MMLRLVICQPWPLLFVIVCVSCCASSISARHQPDRVSPVVVVGTVYCDTCFQQAFSRDSHYISGATVAVECGLERTGPAFYQEVETNNEGMFRVALPFSVNKQIQEIKGCFVKLLKSSESYCPVASTSNSSSFHFKEKKKGKHIFSAGFFTFKPIKQPGLCHQQPTKPDSKLNSLPGFPPDPEISTTPTLNPFLNTFTPIGLDLPSIPTFPNLPQLPSLPPFPPLPRLPNIPYFNTNPLAKRQVKRGDISETQFFFSPIIGSPPSDVMPPNLIQPSPLVPDPSQSPPPFVPDPSQSPQPLVPDPSQVPSPLVTNPFLPPSPLTLLPSVPLFPSLPNLSPVLIIPGVMLTSPPPPSSAYSFPTPPDPFSHESGIPSPPTLVSPQKVNP